jgi:benzoate-CoA ligase family protein
MTAAAAMMTRYDDVPEQFNLTSYFLDRHVEEGRGDRTALIADGEDWTYRQLAGLTNRIGHALRSAGVQREQRVLMVLDDGPEFVATWYATLKIGATTAEIYTFLAAKDFVYYLQYTRAPVAVVAAACLDRFREAAAGSRYLRRTLVLGATADQLRAGESSLEELIAQAPDELTAEPTSRDDLAIWKFTTGSTGAPKACAHRMHAPLLSFASYGQGVLRITEEDRVLPVPKLFFGYARDITTLYSFGVGATGVVFRERTTPERIFALIARHRPTILVNVPTMIRAMLEHPDASTQDLSSLRVVTSAGEALPPDLYDRWMRTFGVELLDGLGSSEAYHIFLSCRPGAVRPGSLGQPVPGYTVRVVDDAGHDVPRGQIGRLWIEGPTTAAGYFNDHRKSIETFAGDRVMSGDLCAEDGDGFFWYRGRADQLLKVGGIWVAPAEIEQSLLTHPWVADCAVVGYHQEGLQRPRAFVVLRDGHTAGDSVADELRRFVKEQLSPHKFPRDIRFLEALPRTASGKTDRQALILAGNES